jgi:hypothetical protein
LGGSQSGEHGQNERQFLHAPIFSDATLSFKGGAAAVAGIAAISKVRPASAVQSWACEASLLATLFAAVAFGQQNIEAVEYL